MKKYHLYLWLLALAGLITSCSQDDNADMLQTTDNNTVSITATLPADFAQIGTRALPTPPSESHRLRCILEVWDKDLTTCKVRQEICPGAGDTEIKFAFELESTGDYKALLWADYITASSTTSQTIAGITGDFYGNSLFYTTATEAGLKAVEFKNLKNWGYANIKQRDAFSACLPFTKEATALTGLSATLTRPHAKLTLAEKNATNFGYCNAVKLTVTSPNMLNVGTDEVSGTKTEELSNAGNWAQAETGKDITINNAACKVLYSTYILVSKNGGTMEEMGLKFTPTDESGKTLKDVTIPAGIPVKRNHRTNAAGTLIVAEDAPSTAVSITVDVNSDWATPDVNEEIDLAKMALGREVSGADATDGKDHVFEISTEAQLRALHVLIVNRTEMNGATENKEYTHATYKLIDDINLNDAAWTPIGCEPGKDLAEFRGTFDGQGHTISGLNVSGEFYYPGLFGYNTGVIRHLAVKGSITNTKEQSVYLGGIAGANTGTIAFCSFEGDIRSSATVFFNIGGICGEAGSNSSKIISCFASTTPTDNGGNAATAYRGGIIGKNGSATVQGCTWYYNSEVTPSGIKACYKGWTSGGDGENNNASYADDSGLSSRVSTMNSYSADYDYQWQYENGTLKLVPKN